MTALAVRAAKRALPRVDREVVPVFLGIGGDRFVRSAHTRLLAERSGFGRSAAEIFYGPRYFGTGSLVGINHGYLRVNPIQLDELLTASFLESRISQVLEEIQPGLTRRVVELFKHYGAVAISPHQRVEGKVLHFFDGYDGRVVINLGKVGSARRQLTLRTEGPCRLRDFGSGGQRSPGEVALAGFDKPRLEIEFKDSFRDGSDELWDFKIGREGACQFVHWPHDRRPMETRPLSIAQARTFFESKQLLLGEAYSPTDFLTHTFMDIHLEPLNRVFQGNSRFFVEAKRVLGEEPVYCYLPPAFCRRAQIDDRSLALVDDVGIFPTDLLDLPDFEKRLMRIMGERGRETDIRSDFLWILNEIDLTRRTVLTLAGPEEALPIKRVSFPTKLFDQIAQILIRHEEEFKGILVRYRQVTQTVRGDSQKWCRALPETLDMVVTFGQRRENRYSIFCSSVPGFCGVVPKVGSPLERQLRQSFDEIFDLGLLIRHELNLSPEQERLFGMRRPPVIDV